MKKQQVVQQQTVERREDVFIADVPLERQTYTISVIPRDAEMPTEALLKFYAPDLGVLGDEFVANIDDISFQLRTSFAYYQKYASSCYSTNDETPSTFVENPVSSSCRTCELRMAGPRSPVRCSRQAILYLTLANSLNTYRLVLKNESYTRLIAALSAAQYDCTQSYIALNRAARFTRTIHSARGREWWVIHTVLL
jgi:hypothetical protein